jgi:hypothetical protein
LKTIACFRFILPRQEIMIAGGRTVNLRDAQSMIFMAGASALMVGNYLTTLNQPVEKDLQMLKDLGLDPNWDKHVPPASGSHRTPRAPDLFKRRYSRRRTRRATGRVEIDSGRSLAGERGNSFAAVLESYRLYFEPAREP